MRNPGIYQDRSSIERYSHVTNCASTNFRVYRFVGLLYKLDAHDG